MNNKIEKLVEFMKKGSKIHIKESQKGSFTKYCNGKVTNECIQRGLNSPDPKIRKKANFARNSRSWSKHQDGGIVSNNENIAVKRYNSAYKALVDYGYSPEEAATVTPFIIGQAVNESGWVDRADNNYGGYLNSDKTRMKFASEYDFFKKHINNLSKKWPDFIKAKNIDDYLKTIHSGKYDYAPIKDNPGYDSNVKSVTNSIVKHLIQNLNRPTVTTKLTPEEEVAFKKWYDAYSSIQHLNPNPETQQYDLRGYWKNRTTDQIKSEWQFGNHLPDTYKLPDHPTFSNESIYSSGLKQGGRWKEIPIPNIDAGTIFIDSTYTKNR